MAGNTNTCLVNIISARPPGNRILDHDWPPGGWERKLNQGWQGPCARLASGGFRKESVSEFDEKV